MDGESTSKLFFDNLELNDTATYACTAKFFDISSTTNTATLEVYGKKSLYNWDNFLFKIFGRNTILPYTHFYKHNSYKHIQAQIP